MNTELDGMVFEIDTEKGRPVGEVIDAQELAAITL